MRIIRTEAKANLRYRHYMDAEGRMYFAAQEADFPLLHELCRGENLVPWIVLLPLYITRQNPQFDFPYLTNADAPWVTVLQNQTRTRYVLYAAHADFRPGRAVGVAFIARVRLEWSRGPQT